MKLRPFFVAIETKCSLATKINPNKLQNRVIKKIKKKNKINEIHMKCGNNMRTHILISIFLFMAITWILNHRFSFNLVVERVIWIDLNDICWYNDYNLHKTPPKNLKFFDMVTIYMNLKIFVYIIFEWTFFYLSFFWHGYNLHIHKI